MSMINYRKVNLVFFVFVICTISTSIQAREFARSSTSNQDMIVDILEDGSQVPRIEYYRITTRRGDDRKFCKKIEKIKYSAYAISLTPNISRGSRNTVYTTKNIYVHKDGRCNFNKNFSVPVWQFARSVFGIEPPNGVYDGNGNYRYASQQAVANYLKNNICNKNRRYNAILKSTVQHKPIRDHQRKDGGDAPGSMQHTKRITYLCQGYRGEPNQPTNADNLRKKTIEAKSNKRGTPTVKRVDTRLQSTNKVNKNLQNTCNPKKLEIGSSTKCTCPAGTEKVTARKNHNNGKKYYIHSCKVIKNIHRNHQRSELPVQNNPMLRR